MKKIQTTQTQIYKAKFRSGFWTGVFMCFIVWMLFSGGTQDLKKCQLQIMHLKEYLVEKQVQPLMNQTSQLSLNHEQYLANLIEIRQLLKKIQYQNDPIYYQLLQMFAKYFQHHNEIEQSLKVNIKLFQLQTSNKNYEKSNKYFILLRKVAEGNLKLNKFDQALTYFLAVLQQMEIMQKDQKSYSLEKGKVYEDIGQCYEQKEDFLSAWNYYKKGLLQIIQLRKKYSKNVETSIIGQIDNTIQQFKSKLEKIQNKLRKSQF